LLERGVHHFKERATYYDKLVADGLTIPPALMSLADELIE
jgi:hypothetical protein